MTQSDLPPNGDKPQAMKAGGTKPWLRILLVASLGLNLLILGMFVGARFSGDGPRGPGYFAGKDAGKDMRRDASRLPIGPYGRAFSKEDRAKLRASLGKRQQSFNAHRENMRAAATQLVETLRAEPFDIDAVRAVLMDQRGTQIALQDEGQAVFLDHLATMSSEARATFADNLEKGLKRRKPRQ